ncbi:MAG: hypothetical protein ACPL06_00065 [Candidatus Anstonellales archaeon]
MRGYLSFLLVISFLAISLNFIHSFLYYKTFSQDKAIMMEKAYQTELDYKALTKAYATGATISATTLYVLQVGEKATIEALGDAAKCLKGAPACFVAAFPVRFVSNFKIDELKSYIKKSVAFSTSLVWLDAVGNYKEKGFKAFPWCGQASRHGLKETAREAASATTYHPFPTPRNAVNGWGSSGEYLANYFSCEDAVDVEVSFDPEKVKALKVSSESDVKNYLADFMRLLSIDVYLGSGGFGGEKLFGYTIYEKYYNYGKTAYYPREDGIHINMGEIIDGDVEWGDAFESGLGKTGFDIERVANYTG